MLEKVQIGCPLHPHLSLSVISLGFMLVNLPLTLLVLSHFGSKSCSYLLLTKRLRASFFCLSWLLSLFVLDISQMLAVKTVHGLPLIFCPEEPFHQMFSRNPLWYLDTVKWVLSKGRVSLRCYYTQSHQFVQKKIGFSEVNLDEVFYTWRGVLPVQASWTKCFSSLQKQLTLSN